MTRTIPLFAGVAFAVALVLPAWAGEANGGSVANAAKPADHAKQYEAHERGEHRMSGTITAINHETGVIDLNTKEAALQLHYPPKFIHHLKKGERLTVDLAYAKMGPEQGSASASNSKAKNEWAEKEHARHERGEHWMTGEVTKVDAKTGVIDVKTAEAPLILHFPPTSIKDLKTGDHIAVQLGFETHKRMKKQASAKNY
jgi:hypothetical protein